MGQVEHENVIKRKILKNKADLYPYETDFVELVPKNSIFQHASKRLVFQF